MRVLLVEDNEDSRDLFRTMLAKLGHEVIEAANGKDAIRTAMRQGADFVLMDLSMPEIDGFEAASALRSMSTFAHVPIVALTSYPPSYWKEKAENAGYDGYVQKPLSFEQLSSVLKAHSPSQD